MIDEKLSANQFMILIFIFTVGTSILILPSGLAATAGADAWIANFLGIILGFLFVWIYGCLVNRIGKQTLLEYCRDIFGKWLGSLFVLLFVVFGFIGASTLLFYTGNFLTTQIMPDTPIQVINALFAVIVVMGIRLGMETLARAAEIFIPWIIVLTIIIVLFLIPEINVENFQPFFEKGTHSIIKAAISYMGTAIWPLTIFLILYPASIQNPSHVKRGFYIGTATAGITVLVITFLCIGVLNALQTSMQMYPTYSLAKKINVGDFIQRIEAVIAGLWFITIFFKMTMYLFACILGFSQLLNLRDYRPLTLPFGMLMVVASLIVYPNVAYMQKWDSTVYIPYALAQGLLLPVLLIIAGATKRWIYQRKGHKSLE